MANAGESELSGEILIEEGVVTHEEVLRAISESGMKGTALAMALEAVPHVRWADLAAFLSADFSPPVLVDLRQLQLSTTAMQLVPESLARKHTLVPVAVLGDLLCIAKADFYNPAAVRELRRASRMKIKVLQADAGQVMSAINRLYKGTRIELPAPKEARQETTRFRAAPPSVEEEAVFEAIPLFSSNEERHVEKARPQRVEEVIDIVDATKVPAQEYALACRQPFVRLVSDFDDTFRSARLVAAQRNT